MDDATFGRPRDARIDDALLQSALEELAERGYEGLSLARVADSAGTSRQALYRRYPGKPELVAAAVDRLGARAPQPPQPTGDCWDDLIAFLEQDADWYLRSGAGAAVVPLLLRPEGDPLGAVARRAIAPRRRRLRALLRSAVAAGEVRPDLDLDVTVDVLTGALQARWQAAGRLPATWPARLMTALVPALEA